LTPRVEAFYRSAQGSDPALLSSPEELDAMIDELLSGPVHENMAALYSLDRPKLPSGAADHQLLVGVDRERGIGLVGFMDADGNVITVGPPDGRDEVVYYSCGEITEFPGPSEVPVDLVRQAAREFLASGGQRPTCVQWQVPAY
jgi:immunity protein Imm1 of predicted polymorphic toxin system